MGLGICVGGLADSLDDPETHEDQLKRFQELNAALERAGLPRHDEPEIPCISAHETSYSTIHYLLVLYRSACHSIRTGAAVTFG